MNNEYDAIYQRNARVQRTFVDHSGEWPRKRFADFVDNWAAWGGFALIVILAVSDFLEYGW